MNQQYPCPVFQLSTFNFQFTVRIGGLEPPPLSGQDPKSCAATNYAISAWAKNRAKIHIFSDIQQINLPTRTYTTGHQPNKTATPPQQKQAPHCNSALPTPPLLRHHPSAIPSPRHRHPLPTPSVPAPTPLRLKTVKQPVNSRSGDGGGTERSGSKNIFRQSTWRIAFFFVPLQS